MGKELKKCAKCDAEKPLSEFTGTDYYCKEHRAIINAAYSLKYAARKARIREMIIARFDERFTEA